MFVDFVEAPRMFVDMEKEALEIRDFGAWHVVRRFIWTIITKLVVQVSKIKLLIWQ